MTERLTAQVERIERVRSVSGLSDDQIADRILLKRDTMRKYSKGYQPASDRIMTMIEQIPAQLQRERPGSGTTAVLREDDPTFETGPRFILKRAREAAGLTPDQLGKKAKVPPGYIRQIEAGEVQGSNEKQIRKLAAALNLDPELLLSGSDHPPLLGAGITFGAKPNVATTAGIEAKTIPLISMAQAGNLTSYEDVYDREGVIEYAKRGPKTFAVRIRGDSMEPRYPDGTIAIVEPDKPLQTERRVITKLRDGSVLFKQLQFTGDTFRLVSLNPLYAPIVIGQQDFEWMYRVVRTQREEED